MYKKNHKGFTLIELLVSVVIIGILASFSIAFFNEYRNKVYVVEMDTYARNAITALTAAASSLDHSINYYAGTYFPDGTVGNLHGVGSIEELLPGMPAPKNLTLYVSFHFDCYLGLPSCSSAYIIQLSMVHCKFTTNRVWYFRQTENEIVGGSEDMGLTSCYDEF